MSIKNRFRVSLTASLALLAAVASGQNKVVYVDDDATGANDGTSWANAYIYLQDALVDASDSPKPVEVRVAQGIYKPDRGAAQVLGDREATFQLIDGVALIGGLRGAGATDPNARDVATYETILSGDLAGNDIVVGDLESLGNEPTRQENVLHITTGTGTAATAVLEGFTICNGHADGPWERDDNTGAGMYNADSHCTVRDCIFRDNVADYGGGIYLRRGAGTVTGCTFRANLVIQSGGGARNYESNSTFLDCRFTDNLSLGGGGGGVANQSGHPTLIDCVFYQNVGHDGGGVYNVIGDATLTRCEFIEN